MAFDISAAKFCRDLGDKLKVIVVRVDDEIKKYHVHKKKLLLLESSLPIPISDDNCVMEVESVNHEVMDEFVAWLYSSRRSHQLQGLASVPLLLDIYRFACDHDIKDLESDCYYVMFEYPTLLVDLKEIFDAADVTTQELITKAVTGFSRYSIGFDEDAPREDVVWNYIHGLNFRCPLLCNVAMDKLTALMEEEQSFFTLADHRDIFEQTDHGSKPRIRLFCVALIHFQRRTDDFENSIPDDQIGEFFKIPGFRDLYEKYEQKFLWKYAHGDSEMSLDPRVPGNLDICDFHDHSDNERCHLRREEEENVEGDEDEEDSEDIESRASSHSPEPSEPPNWHGNLIVHKKVAQEHEDQLLQKEQERKKNRAEFVKKRANLTAASSPRNKKRKSDAEHEDDEDTRGGQRQKLS